MTFVEAKYLKSSGKKIDTKVTIAIIDKMVEIYIRDSVFYEFKKALQYLRHIAETELTNLSDEFKPEGK